MSGILRVPKESVFSGLNKLEVFSLLSPRFSSHFGLLYNEVEELLKYYEIGFDIEEVCTILGLFLIIQINGT